MTTDFRDWALYYASRGWAVFPLIPRTKRPLTASGFKDATTDIAQIDAWWAAVPDANIGIACGASRLLVVDLDEKNGKNGPAHWAELAAAHGGDGAPLEHNTGSGGLHLIYQAGEDLTNRRGSLPAGIDIRGVGGYIVVAPSIHPDGGRYSWPKDELKKTLSDAPAWLVEMLQTSRLPDAAPVSLAGGHTLTRADLEAFIAKKAKYEDAAPAVRAAKAVLSGEPWADRGERHTRLVEFLGKLRTFVADTHGKLLDPESSSELFAATCEAVNEQGVKDPTSPSWVANLIATLQVNDEGYRGQLEAARAEKKASKPDGSKLELPEVAAERRGVEPAGHPVKPRWNIETPHPKEIVDQVIALLGSEPEIFCNDKNQIIRVIENLRKDLAPAQIEPASPEWVRETLCEIADWYVTRKGEMYPTKAPADIVGFLFARRAYPTVRRLFGVAMAPFFREDKTLCVSEGYDEQSSQWLALRGLKLPEIAEQPTRDDAIAACARLKDLLVDFVFEDPGMTSIWLSMLLTPLARPVHSPIHHAQASNQGTGKGLFCESAMQIAIGQKLTSVWPEDPAEQAKTITSASVEGRPVVWLDNIARTHVLGGAAIEGAVSEGAVGRVLGVSKMAPPLLYTTFITNGNNTRMTPDVARRTLKAVVLATTANPALRDTTKFKYPKLKQHIKANRARYLADALTILRAYYAAGAPVQPTRDMAFDDWSRDVASAIVWLGEPDPAQYVATLDESADESTEALVDLVGAMEEMQKQGDRTAIRPGQLLTVDPSTPDGERVTSALSVLGLSVKGDHRAVAALLRRHEGQVVALPDGRELCIRRVKNPHSKAWEYQAAEPKRQRKTA